MIWIGLHIKCLPFTTTETGETTENEIINEYIVHLCKYFPPDMCPCIQGTHNR